MSKENVVVGCKLPNGLVIRLGEQEVTLNGANSSKIVGGHGLTDVNKDFWSAWLEQHKDFAPVVAGLIFANDNFAKTRDEANEKQDNESGFEGINPDKPGKGIKKASEKDDE